MLKQLQLTDTYEYHKSLVVFVYIEKLNDNKIITQNNEHII